MRFEKKDILDIESLEPGEISMILDTAQGMKEAKVGIWHVVRE